MIDGASRLDLPAPGAVGWIDVSADHPDTVTGRTPIGPLGMHIAPLRFGRAPYFVKGARLRGARCIWTASTVSGAELVRPPRTPSPPGFEGGVHVMARVEASGPVFDPIETGTGVLRVFDALDDITEQFTENTHLYTLNIPPGAIGVEASVIQQMHGVTYDLTPFQVQVLRAAVGLVPASETDLSTASSLIGLDRYLAALAGLLLRTSVRRPSVDAAQVEGLRARTDAIIYEQAADPALTPAAIATQLNVSLRQLYRAFNGVESPAARIRRRRLERAAEILASRAGPGQVERIAQECGFTSAEYFSRAFRREFGLSPRAYRSAHRETSAVAR